MSQVSFADQVEQDPYDLDVPVRISDDIPREKMIAALDVLGYDPKDAREMILTPRYLVAEVFVLDEKGNRQVEGNEVVTERVTRWVRDDAKSVNGQP